MQSPASRFAEKLLVGAVEAIARAGAKALESLASDAKTALRNEAAKIEAVQKKSEAWRAAAAPEMQEEEKKR